MSGDGEGGSVADKIIADFQISLYKNGSPRGVGGTPPSLPFCLCSTFRFSAKGLKNYQEAKSSKIRRWENRTLGGFDPLLLDPTTPLPAPVNMQVDVRATDQPVGRTAMHHFRGRLFQGNEIRLNPANVYIDYGSTEGEAASEWSGYLLVESEKAVVAGGTYTLKLEDGRAGELRIDTIAPDDSGKVRATFIEVAGLK